MKSLRAKKQGEPVTYRRTYPFLHLPWSHLLRPGISGRHHQRLWKIVSLGGVYAYLECHGTSTWCNPSCLILKFQETSICLSWVVFSCFFQKTNGNDLQNLVAQGCDCFQYSDRCMWKRPTVARCLGANEAAGGSWLAANGGDLQFSHDLSGRRLGGGTK